MRFLILESREGSGFGDDRTSYEFPSRYKRFFEGISPRHPAIGVIYEPKRQGGRQAFVGWVSLSSEPVRSDRNLWRIYYDGMIHSFDEPVPRLLMNQPVEHWLRSIPRREHGSRLQGKSVREIGEQNALEILELGSTPHTRIQVHQAGSQTKTAAERVRRTVEILTRNACFRDTVLTAYQFRCAITGLTKGCLPPSRIGGAIEAAHIRPVFADGPDSVQNGFILTPTLHRFFDSGLFTLEVRREKIVVKRSKALVDDMLINRQRGTIIRLETGMELLLPGALGDRPHKDFLDYHNKHIFERAA